MKISPHEFIVDQQESAVIVLLDSAEMKALDHWISKQGDPQLSRAEGIRMMMVMAMNDRRQQPRHDQLPVIDGSDSSVGE